MKTTEPFIETPQGIFIQHAGWLRITSDFLDKSYAELWEIRDKSAVFVEINDWALAFGSFPAFFILPLFLFLPTGLVGLIGIGLMVLVSLFMAIGFSAMGTANMPELPFSMSVFSIIYVLFAAIYFFPVYYLYQYVL